MLRMSFGKMKIDWKKIRKIGKARIKLPKTRTRTIKLKQPSKIQSIIEQHDQYFK